MLAISEWHGSATRTTIRVVTQDDKAKLPLLKRTWVIWVPVALVAMVVGLLLAGLFARTSPTPDSSPSRSSTSIEPQPCTAVDVLAESNLEGATGSLAGGIVVTNDGVAACILSGPPRSVELRSGDDVLDIALTTYPGLLADSLEAAPPILLEPGDKARSFINWTNWCAGSLPSLEMQVVLPDGSDPMFVALESGSGPATTPRCDNPAAPSSLGVFAFAPLPN